MRDLTQDEIENMSRLLHQAMKEAGHHPEAVAPAPTHSADGDGVDRQVALLKQTMASLPPSI